MSKVKSAVISALVIIAIIVAAFFATISYPINDIERFNSVASSIRLSGDFTGHAYATLVPEGVITSAEYADKSAEDKEGYEKVGVLYIEKEFLDGRKKTGDETREQTLASLREEVLSDAEKISARIAKKAYSDYSVSVQDGYCLKVAIPTGFTAAESKYDETSRNAKLRNAQYALAALSVDGRVTLRTTEETISIENGTYRPRKDEYTKDALVDGAQTYSFLKVTEDAEDFFTGVSSRTIGGTAVITVSLSDYGRERIKDISTKIASISDSDKQQLYFFVGTTQIINAPCSATLDTDKIELTSSSADMLENYAITLNSAVKGGALGLDYKDMQTNDVFVSTAAAGENAALIALIITVVLLAAFIAAFAVKYKMLGAVCAMVTLIFALVVLYAIYLLGVELTVAGILTAFIGLSLLSVSNLIVFEEIRKQTAKGKTMQASVKDGYKRVLMTVTDMHIVLFVISIFLAFVARGVVASCGVIMLISVLASYALYWITRFMWYVVSSPVKDKFRFGGYKRQVYGDD